MQIILAHLHPAPFVQQVGRAIWEAGMLTQFATTFVDRPEALWHSYLCRFANFFQVDLARQLQRRSVVEFPLSLVKDYPGWEILRVLVGQIDKDKRLTDVVFHWGINGFDDWVASQALTGASAVYGYEYACLATFQAAKKQSIACIYDVPSPEHNFVEN